jgi:GNAT superfamily N-acetyltransferase
VSTGTLAFEQVQADDEAALREWFGLRRAVQDADLPDDPALGWALHTGMLQHPWPGSENRVFLARRDAVLMAWLGLGLPQTENLGTMTVELEVDPAYRRQGVGRALVAEARRLAAELGRERTTPAARSSAAR